MKHPEAFRPETHAAFKPDKMGKATLFESDRILVGLNCFEPGQEHKLHAHAGMDKVYQVLEGSGLFLLEEREIAMQPGTMLVAPENQPRSESSITNGPRSLTPRPPSSRSARPSD